MPIALHRSRLLLLRCVLTAVILILPGSIPASATSPVFGRVAPRQATALKVWVNTSSGVYHCPGTRYYGTTKRGAYSSETDARENGYRPAFGKPCGPLPVLSDSAPKRGLATAAPSPDAGPKVWVNTSSGVYHCPGTRYYGNTKSGKYMTEAAAKAAGNRPAYGRSCS